MAEFKEGARVGGGAGEPREASGSGRGRTVSGCELTRHLRDGKPIDS